MDAPKPERDVDAVPARSTQENEHPVPAAPTGPAERSKLAAEAMPAPVTGPSAPHEAPPPALGAVPMAATAPPAAAPPDTRSAAQEALAAAKLLGRQLGLLTRAAAADGARRARGASERMRDRVRGQVQGAGPVLGRIALLSTALRARLGRLLAPIGRAGAVLGRLRLRPRRGPVLGLLTVLGLVALVPAAYIAYAIATIPIGGGIQAEAGSALVLEDAGGQVFATRGAFRGERLSAADLPPHLAQAIVSVEDRRFYRHAGVDVRGILRAMWRNTQAGGTREGASTITQQLVRMMYLSQDRTLKRKVQEAALALWLERQLPKDEILVRYLNTAYFGAGAYGVDAAAKRYFGKPARELTLAEAAMLAGLVRAPSQLAPTRNLGGAKERADTVLQTMIETGAITAAEADAARRAPVNLRTPPDTPPGANYFVDLAVADARRLLGQAGGDLTLRTTLNLDLQRLAEGVIERRLEAEGARKEIGQAALVALGPDGAILAMVGGRDYEASQFNRAIQARRQAGSLFKLFVYLAALQRGYTPQSAVTDAPTQIGDWEPQNANGRFRGQVTLREAFAGSINTVAARLADEVGLPAVIEAARRLGVQSDLPAVPSLALGAAEVTLLEMTRAYAGVAAGNPVEPYAVRAIGTGGQQRLTARPASSNAAGLGPARAMMLDLLQAVVAQGTGRGARVEGMQVAGKTGTTQENRDAWFIGFTPDIVVGIWVGNDDNAPMKGVTGGDVPATIFREFVTRAVPLVTGRGPAAASAAPQTPRGAGQSARLEVRPEARAEGGVRGVPEVVDTGTLEIRGRVVKLHGLEGEGGRLASQLARFLRRREVACEPAGNLDAQRCQLDGEDLSELILAAGGARAAANAPPDLLAAEEQARAGRLGIWRRGR